MIITVYSASLGNIKCEDITVTVPNSIDNREGRNSIAIREFSYVVGYYNIAAAFENNVVYMNSGTELKKVVIDDGLYNIDQHFKEFTTKLRALVFPMPVAFDRVFRYAKLEHNGRVRFDYVGAAKEYKFIISKENKDLFRLDEEKTITDNDISNKPEHFLKYTNLYVHVDQIKNDKNYYNVPVT